MFARSWGAAGPRVEDPPRPDRPRRRSHLREVLPVEDGVRGGEDPLGAQPGRGCVGQGVEVLRADHDVPQRSEVEPVLRPGGVDDECVPPGPVHGRVDGARALVPEAPGAVAAGLALGIHHGDRGWFAPRRQQPCQLDEHAAARASGADHGHVHVQSPAPAQPALRRRTPPLLLPGHLCPLSLTAAAQRAL